MSWPRHAGARRTLCHFQPDNAANQGSSTSNSYSLTPVLIAVAISCAGAFAFGYNLGGCMAMLEPALPMQIGIVESASQESRNLNASYLLCEHAGMAMAVAVGCTGCPMGQRTCMFPFMRVFYSLVF